MIGQVHAEHRVVWGESPGERAEVAAGTEQSVQHYDRRTLSALTEMNVRQTRFCYHALHYNGLDSSMRITSFISHRAATVILGALLLTACAGAPTYNPTVFPFEIDQDALAQQKIKTVVIPHVNLGPPSRNYLEQHAPRIDGMVAAFLKENDYKVIPQREFEQRYNAAERAYGNPVDPTTGKMNMRAFAQIMEQVRDQMQAQGRRPLRTGLRRGQIGKEFLGESGPVNPL